MFPPFFVGLAYQKNGSPCNNKCWGNNPKKQHKCHDHGQPGMRYFRQSPNFPCFSLHLSLSIGACQWGNWCISMTTYWCISTGAVLRVNGNWLHWFVEFGSWIVLIVRWWVFFYFVLFSKMALSIPTFGTKVSLYQFTQKTLEGFWCFPPTKWKYELQKRVINQCHRAK